MTDVYNSTVFNRNDIQDIPSGFIDDTANDLFRFMGSFWKNLHEGGDFIKGIQKVRGIMLAQFYLNLLETLKLQDRRGLPVFHRELWKPLILRKSWANESQENSLHLGEDIVLGEQPSGSKYGEGTVLQLGKLANLENYVTYAVHDDIVTIGKSIMDNIINPTVSYGVSTEFPSDADAIYRNGTLIFPLDKDPFGENSPFYVYDVVDDDTGKDDTETVLWVSDVLIDKSYVSEHMAYALGIDCQSSDITKRIINAGWDSINCGLTPTLLRTLLGAMLNIPVIQENTETVNLIVEKDGDNKKIITDHHTYTVFRDAKLRSCVKLGAVLHKGEYLDESVKIYPILTDFTEAKLKGSSEYADIFKTDVPVISIPRTLLRSRTSNGIAVDWNPVEVMDTGELDANGHRKLFFELGGSEEDVTSFWKDVWDTAERENINIEEYLRDSVYKKEESSDSSSSDPTWMIVPAEFFLHYMIGANTMIITLDRSQIEDESLMRSAMFFDILNRVVPSGMRLFFIEHTQIDDARDTYNLGEVGSSVADTEEEIDDCVSKDLDDEEDEFDYSDLPGMRGKKIPTYEDQLKLKMYRNRKRSANEN